jgi:Amt family ammonium transporter
MSSDSSSVFDTCEANLSGDADTSVRELLACVSYQLEQTGQSSTAAALDYARTVLVVYSAVLVFFMQAGFAMVCAGAVRRKNVQNTLLKNLLDTCGASIAFYALGYAFAFGGQDMESPNKTFIGTSNFFLVDVEDYAFWLFQWAFSAASATIIAGTLAERCQMAAYLGYSMVLAGWVYPIIAHSIWNHQGWLSAYSPDPLWGTGMVDFAGSGVVHLTGGTAAIFATYVLGPRQGRFQDEDGHQLEKAKTFSGHSPALQMLGTFILWFGWYGFNCGSALILDSPDSAEIAAWAAVNTTLAGGSAGITALMVHLYILERYTGEPFFDLKYAMNGSLCGLVAITGGCGVVEAWAAVVIGCMAGLLYIFGSWALVRAGLDDAVDAIPVHMLNGMWGIIAVGLFASPTRLEAVYGRSEHTGIVYSFQRGHVDATLLGAQLAGILFIVGFVGVFMFPFFLWLDYKGWFRSDALEEIVGLDTSYHGRILLLRGDDEVSPEHISAFQEKRNVDRRRRSNPRSLSTRAVEDDFDDVDEDKDERS